MSAAPDEERIPLPERLETRSRLGPFPTGADALKFLLVSAVGALVALRFGPLLWTPFLAVGFLVSVHRRQGLSLDERVGHYLAFRWRRRVPVVHAARAGTERVGSVLRLANGRWAAVFETGGVPIAFLPTEAARRVFDTYRQLLRSTELPVQIHSGRTPIRPGPFLPLLPAASGPEGAARSGYQELVRLLARRRQRRTCRVVLLSDPEGNGAALRRLESTLEGWTTTLAGLEVAVRRLRGPELAELVFRSGAGVGG